jgi:cell fate regulator YaaT (PSP1 superfamily)
MGDIVATVASPGHDIVTLTGNWWKSNEEKGANPDSNEVPKIYRKASQKDIDIWSAARGKEEPMKVRARELAISQNWKWKYLILNFKEMDLKPRFTTRQMTELILDFWLRISPKSSVLEMKQVGFRQEGSFRRNWFLWTKLCCSTWLTDFRSVNTSAARYQQLSLNPQNAGQCGKLKCCLNYELDTYMDALKGFLILKPN